MLFHPPLNIKAGQTLEQVLAEHPDTEVLEFWHDAEDDIDVQKLRQAIFGRPKPTIMERKMDVIIGIILVLAAAAIVIWMTLANQDLQSIRPL